MPRESRRVAALKDLSVTTLEVMPVAQFPGARSLGYDGVFSFAAQVSDGGPRALQRLIDACHACRLDILLDVVNNHFGAEGCYHREFSPYLSPRYGLDGQWADDFHHAVHALLTGERHGFPPTRASFRAPV
ncbi:MAG TPA: alpha-amylase family glycosyl hydrolase [Gemmataceae bacterium]|nr:alpha-amylase family glycosyl hydrolase [Gemmataceae bacterium]